MFISVSLCVMHPATATDVAAGSRFWPYSGKVLAGSVAINEEMGETNWWTSSASVVQGNGVASPVFYFENAVNSCSSFDNNATNFRCKYNAAPGIEARAIGAYATQIVGIDIVDTTCTSIESDWDTYNKSCSVATCAEGYKYFGLRYNMSQWADLSDSENVQFIDACTPVHINTEKYTNISQLQFMVPYDRNYNKDGVRTYEIYVILADGMRVKIFGPHVLYGGRLSVQHNINLNAIYFVPCSPGSYKATVSQPYMYPFTYNWVQYTTNKSALKTMSCTLTARGYYQDESGATTQKECPTGTYSDTTGAVQCTQCENEIPIGASYKGGNTTSTCAWACPVGYLVYDGACRELCPHGKYFNTATGIQVPIYKEKITTPSVGIKFENVSGDNICYSPLELGGMPGTINIEYNGNTYHMVIK